MNSHPLLGQFVMTHAANRQRDMPACPQNGVDVFQVGCGSSSKMFSLFRQCDAVTCRVRHSPLAFFQVMCSYSLPSSQHLFLNDNMEYAKTAPIQACIVKVPLTRRQFQYENTDLKNRPGNSLLRTSMHLFALTAARKMKNETLNSRTPKSSKP